MLLFSASVALAQSPPPRVFFTDLQSGPNTGGKNNKGTILTLYGKWFGSAQGTSTVTVGGGPVAAYLQWGVPAPAGSGMQKIAVAIGAAAKTGPVVVRTPKGDSNADVTFTVRPEKIYCVATTGSDSNNGSFSTPWRTLGHAVNTIGPGDIIYGMNGVSENTAGNVYAAALILGTPGLLGRPKALVAYPGATVTVGTPTGWQRGVLLCAGLSSCPDGSYWVVAGLVIRAISDAVSIRTNAIRVVGNDISCPNGNDQAGCLGTSWGNHVIYGNMIHDVAVNTAAITTKLYHSIYLEDGSRHIDLGWNTIANNHANRAIQVYTGAPGAGGGIFDVHIHDNLIHDSRGVGILFNQVDPTRGPVEAYNNVVYNAGQGPDFPDGISAWNCLLLSSFTSGIIQAYNNTVYNCGFNGGGGAGGGAISAGGPANLRNNIIYVLSNQAYFESSSRGTTCDHNLWFGAGTSPRGCTNNLNSDPRFVNLSAKDFHLLPGSPASHAGVNTRVVTDFDGIARPQGAAYDLGAYESLPASTVIRP